VQYLPIKVSSWLVSWLSGITPIGVPAEKSLTPTAITIKSVFDKSLVKIISLWSFIW